MVSDGTTQAGRNRDRKSGKRGKTGRECTWSVLGATESDLPTCQPSVGNGLPTRRCGVSVGLPACLPAFTCARWTVTTLLRCSYSAVRCALRRHLCLNIPPGEISREFSLFFLYCQFGRSARVWVIRQPHLFHQWPRTCVTRTPTRNADMSAPATTGSVLKPKIVLWKSGNFYGV